MAGARADVERMRQIATETAAKISAVKLGIPMPPPRVGSVMPPPRPAIASSSSSDNQPRFTEGYGVKKARHVANAEAIEELIKQARQSQEAGSCPSHHISMIDVPSDLAGLVIGKKGCAAKHYEEHYGVFVQCRQSEANEETGMTPFVLVGGNEEAQTQVKNAIQEIVDKRTKPSLVETLEIPDKFVGFVVGKQGSFFRALQERTGVKLHLNQEKTEADTKVLTMKSQQAEVIESARYILDRQLLDGYRRAQIFNAPLETKFSQDSRSVGDLLAAPFGASSAPNIDAVPDADLQPLDTSLPDLEELPTPSSALLPNGSCGPQNQLGFGRFADVEHMAVGRVSSMEVDAVQGSELYYQTIKQWAQYYAREPDCVEYYSSLRSHAAQAFCGEEVVGQYGGA